MKNILCFGDSNTYGLSPEWFHGNPGRHDRDTRWTGRLQKQLGEDYYVIEEGLSGRTTCFEDPTMPGLKGSDFLHVALATHSPLDLVIIMLGTNDCKDIYSANPFEIGNALACLVKEVLNPYNYMGSQPPKLLIAAPAPIRECATRLGMGIITPKAVEKSEKLAEVYADVAKMYNCDFIDIGAYAAPTDFEGIHLPAEAHAKVADAFEAKIREILE